MGARYSGVRVAAPVVALFVFLLAAGISSAGQTNSLASLKASLNGARAAISESVAQRQSAALKGYAAALDALMEGLKKKGALDAYLVVAAEKKRFASDATVPAPGGGDPAFESAVQAYHRAVAAAKEDGERQAAALLGQYKAALDGLIKQLVREGKIADAVVVKTERDKVDFELADTESKLPGESAGVKTVKRGVPPEAKAFMGHHYLAVCEKTTWHEAKKACEARGGHLVTIASKEENDFLATLGSELTISAMGFLWMGCTDEAKEGDWRWVDGRKVEYSQWYPGEPNNGGGREHYGGSRFLPGRTDWNDVPADNPDNAGYICEWDS
jgi:hypothetical protein